MVSRRGVCALLAVVVVVTGVAILANAHSGGAFFPYDEGEAHVYDIAAKRLLAGTEIYRPDDPKPFTYPPFMALLFVPVAVLPDHALRPLWYACNLAMLAWVVTLLAGLFPRARGHWRFWIPTVVLAGRHVSSVFENQSNDMIVFLFVTLGIHAMCRNRCGRAGAMFGFGAATKATPLLFLPALFWNRRLVAALAMLGGIVVAQLLTEVLCPRQDGRLWVVVWYSTFLSGIETIGGNVGDVGNAWSAWNVRNQNLASLVYRFSTPVEAVHYHTFDVSLWQLDGAARRFLIFGCQLVVIGILAAALRPRRTPLESAEERAYRRLGEGSAVVCGMVLLSPMSSKAHFCVLLLPVAFCCHEYFLRRKNPVLLACLLVLLGGALTSHGVVGSKIGYQVLARGSVTWCALAALVGTASTLGRIRAATSPDPGAGRP